MTAENFVQSFVSHKTGDKGYCRLASISAEKNIIIYDIGFWFEVLRSDKGSLILTIESNFFTDSRYKNTLSIEKKSQLEVLIGNLRQMVQNQLCLFFPCTDDMNNVQLATEKCLVH